MRPERGRRLLLLGIVAAGCGAGAIVLWRVGPDAAADDARAYAARIASLHEASVVAYRAIPTKPVAEFASAADLAQHLRGGVIGDPPEGFGARADELVVEAAEFMVHRFGRSPREYADWCRARGLKLPAMRDLLGGTHMAGSTYRDLFGVDPPGDMTPEQLFDRFADYEAAHAGEAARIVALGGGREGVAIAFGVAEAQERNPSLLSEPRVLLGSGRLDAALWTGGGVGVSYAWWGRGESGDEMLDRIGQTVYAEVGVLAEFSNGKRHPIGLYYFWDPEGRRWSLEAVFIYDIGRGSPGVSLF